MFALELRADWEPSSILFFHKRENAVARAKEEILSESYGVNWKELEENTIWRNEDAAYTIMIFLIKFEDSKE